MVGSWHPLAFESRLDSLIDVMAFSQVEYLPDGIEVAPRHASASRKVTRMI
jgi:hypothetical protein